MRRITLPTFLFLILCSTTAAAASLTVGRASTPPRIDGVLEDVWRDALVFDGFTQLEPSLGSDATVKTEAFLLFDDEYLYMAARAHQSRASIHATGSRRDGASAVDGDYVLFAIDPQGSGNSAYYFIVNAANAVNDGTLDAYGTWLRDWDTRLVSATAVGDDAWTVEIAVPLAAIGLDSPPRDGFGLLAGRYFAQRQETSLSRIADRNSVYRIDKFDRITGLERSKSRTATSLVPYAFGTWKSGSAAAAGGSAKAGFDVRSNPMSSMTILATVNPDFGQIESDEEIINVSDVPAAYPEKRPFFTESSDLYPGLAVNTRNIGTIRVGVKLRQVLPTLRYDLTSVLDDQHTRWTLGDVRWTDNRKYHLEVIGGLKDAPASRDYNVTTNLRTWFFDRRLTAYTWFGTINNHERRANEWESVNSIKWETRTLHAGIWSHVKTELYNPNVVGFDTLSNEVIVEGWLSASYFASEGFVREITPKVDVERHDLYTARGHAWSHTTARVDAAFRPAEALGVWRTTLLYVPAANETFRYRGAPISAGAETHRDAYGHFVLVEQKAPTYCVAVNSDASKVVSFGVLRERKPLRGGTAGESSVSADWKVRRSTILTASFDRVNVTASAYQRAYAESVARFKVEHTFRNGLNMRAVYQRDALDDGSAIRRPALNFLVSYPYDDKTTLYLVVNDDREDRSGSLAPLPASSARNVAFKVSHALSF